VQIGFRDDLAEIVIVTHETREGNFRKALAEVEGLEAIDSVPSVIRVL
jgi:homoserine dehydrogenase